MFKCGFQRRRCWYSPPCRTQIGLEINGDNFTGAIIVESDSLLAINEILKQQDILCELGSLISDIIDLSMNYGTCIFTHIRRSANVLAHNIAKLPCEDERSFDLEEYIPFVPDIILWSIKVSSLH